MPLHPLEAEWDAVLSGGDPLAFPRYGDALAGMEGEAVRTGLAAIQGEPAYVLVEGRFEVLGGSMGAAAGEKVVRAYGRATELGLPVVVVASSGGARMQEGMVALVQLARTAAAARDHAAAGLLSLGIYRGPTTGGVLASYASLVDLRVGEPGATVGFAGPRVVEVVTGSPLPPWSHTAESALAHGIVDELVDRDAQAGWVEAAMGLAPRAASVRPLPPADVVVHAPGAWGEVLRARTVGRPSGIDHAARLCTSWAELRGTDPTVRAGLAVLGGRRVVVIATDRYATADERAAGRPRSDGFRLAQRAIALADRLRLPLVTFVDTPGADVGVEAEAGGIAGEIARTFAAMAALSSPSVSICVGEGGSGGALALAAADVLLIQEHAVFSVIAPEGASVILHRDADHVAEVAEHLGLTSAALRDLGIVDEVVPEPDDPSGAAQAVDGAVARALDRAVTGDRRRRFDAVTARWLREAR